MKNLIDNKDLEKLRAEIKDLIKSLDMSQKEAADVIAEILGRDDDFYECFRADLKRCKNSRKLTNYLDALKESEKYRKLHNMQAKFEGDIEILGEERQRFYQQLGKYIAEYIEKQNGHSSP